MTGTPKRPKLWLFVGLGGAAGSLLRYVIDTVWVGNGGLAVLLINVIGSFALGWLITTVFARPGNAPWLAPALGPGLLGGFTTMSGFALWVNQSALGSGPLISAAYFFASLVLGLLAAWAGLDLGRRRSHTPLPQPTDPGWEDEA